MEELIKLVDKEKAFEVLGEWAGYFGDNGGDPDGNAYLRPADMFPLDVVEELLEAEAAVIVEGYDGEYPWHYWHVPPRHADEWCGYQDDGMVYWT